MGKKICSRRTYLFFKGVRRCRGQVWRKLRSVRVFSKNCASNFFWSVGKGVVIGTENDLFTTERMKIFSLLEMKLALRLRSGQAMKQTAAASLGILGLNEDFVQLNEIMGYENTQNIWSY